MTTTAIKKKLTNYLQVADDKKIKAIYTMVEDDIITKENDWDDDFIAEMKSRIKAYESGTLQTHILEETEILARQAYLVMKKKLG